MHGYFANTDLGWFRFLRTRSDLDEVNFWQPGGGSGFGAIPPGAPFLFKLKKLHYAIGGFGFFAHASRLPSSLAWDAFGEKDGASDDPFEGHDVRVPGAREASSRVARTSYSSLLPFAASSGAGSAASERSSFGVVCSSFASSRAGEWGASKEPAYSRSQRR